MTDVFNELINYTNDRWADHHSQYEDRDIYSEALQQVSFTHNWDLTLENFELEAEAQLERIFEEEEIQEWPI